MKRSIIRLFVLSVITAAFFTAGFARSLPVSGVVRAASDSAAIDSAMVILFEGSLSMTSAPDNFDTVFTNATGAFQKTIEISDTARGVIYAVYKTGYLAKTDFRPFIIVIPNTLNLGTILLKTISDATDTLTVKGEVRDSISKLPLPDALCVVTTGLIGDITVDSITTDAGGRFEKKIPYIKNTNPLFNEMMFFVSKEAYQPKSGRESIPANESVDLGVIELAPLNIQIKKIPAAFPHFMPTHCVVYAMNGKKVYAGTVDGYPRFMHTYPSSQLFIIKYFRNNRFIGAITTYTIR